MKIKFTPEELNTADEEVRRIMYIMEQIGFPLSYMLYKDLMTIVLQEYMMRAVKRFQFE